MKAVFLYLMSFAYILAGLNHFRNPRMYLKIMPPYIPFHPQAVWVSGVLEILFGVLLLFPQTSGLGAWCIIVLLICIFPANIQMAIDFYHKHNPYLWMALLRLPLQALLIWWAWHYTKAPSLPA